MNNLLDKIEDASVNVNDTLLEEAIDFQMNAITDAKNQGYRSTCWSLGCRSRYQDIEAQARELFAKKGYKFKPTGYIGGVWQRTEDIYW